MADPEINLSAPVGDATPAAVVLPLAPPSNYDTSGGGNSGNTFPTSVNMTDEQFSILTAQGFPPGLARDIVNSTAAYPLRFWVVDNSGSMRSNDGNQILGEQNNIKVVPCNRWTELQGTVDYHIDLAALLQVTTVFRMLNNPGAMAGPQEFSIADRSSSSSSSSGGGNQKSLDEELQIAKSVIQNSEPRGVTPLSEHLMEIRRRIEAVAPILQSTGQQAVIVLATDGLPSDNQGISSEMCKRQFIDALRSLQNLPVWLVVRLCTDDDDVVEYYNNLDQMLELPLEVIDDFFGEAREIHQVNKWLNYALPLHRCREMGYHHRIFDLLDERLLNKDELVEFIKLLFGENSLVGIPDVHLDWKGFCAALEKILKQHGGQWDPNTRKMGYWIDMKRLKKTYGGGGFRLFGRK